MLRARDITHDSSLVEPLTKKLKTEKLFDYCPHNLISDIAKAMLQTIEDDHSQIQLRSAVELVEEKFPVLLIQDIVQTIIFKGMPVRNSSVLENYFRTCRLVCKAWASSTNRAIIKHMNLQPSNNYKSVFSNEASFLSFVNRFGRYLEVFEFENCKQIKDKDFLSKVSAYMPNLKLTFCKGLSEEVLNKIARNCTLIVFLSIMDCKITHATCELLATHLQELTYLEISSSIDDGCLVKFANRFSKLKALNFMPTYPVKITDQGLKNLAGSFPLLEMLTLPFYISEIGLDYIKTSFPDLISLELTASLALQLDAIKDSFLKLRMLVLNESHLQSVSEIAHSFPELEALDLSSTSVKDLHPIAQSFLKLYYLDLSYCENINDESFLSIKESYPLLRDIDLEGVEISQEAIVSFAKARPNNFLNIHLASDVYPLEWAEELMRELPHLNFHSERWREESLED